MKMLNREGCIGNVDYGVIDWLLCEIKEDKYSEYHTVFYVTTYFETDEIIDIYFEL